MKTLFRSFRRKSLAKLNVEQTFENEGAWSLNLKAF